MAMTTMTTSRRSVLTIDLTSATTYENPFADVDITATFVAPDGQLVSVPGFYDGDATWRVRFSPDRAGTWRWSVTSGPHDAGLEQSGTIEVTESEHPGFLVSTPGSGWGFKRENGDPQLIVGDTVYHLFGMAWNGIDVISFLQRRHDQGINLIRARVPVSLFHPPDCWNRWQTKSCWPWGGSEQWPAFDRFNLDYFRVVDEVIQAAERIGIGLEVIMEGWGFEFPFGFRNLFVAEWEEMWLRYLVARYDAYSSVWVWTPMNEYEYYPNGEWRHEPINDRWAIRIGRWMKQTAGHGHIVGIHNGPRKPPFEQRLRRDPEAIDAVMYQAWGPTDAESILPPDTQWLALGVDDEIRSGLAGWRGSAVLAEYGYEHNTELPVVFPSYKYCDAERTRRGAWRAAMHSMGAVGGFDNSWGVWDKLDTDQEGVAHLTAFGQFFTEVIDGASFAPDPDRVVSSDERRGYGALAMTCSDQAVLVYLPAGGSAEIDLTPLGSGPLTGTWYRPVDAGADSTFDLSADGTATVDAPASDDGRADWALVVRLADAAG